MSAAVVLGMIVTMFPEPREQAKAIGMYAFVASAGGSIGLLAGGVLTQAISWHWIFFVNLPIGIATVVGALRLLPADKGLGLRAGADLPGAALITGALMLGVYTIVEPAAEHGWGAGTTLGLGATALALLVFFVVREATAKTPLMPLRIFRARLVTGANLVQGLLVVGMFGVFFLGALYLQRTLGYDALQTGLAFLPSTIAMGALSMRFTEPLISRFGAYRTLLPGVVLIGVGLALFVRAPLDGSYVVDVLPTTLLLGIGAGLCFPALMTLAMSGATPQDAGLASGLVNTSAQVGGAIGLAVLATLSSSRTESLAAAGHDAASALVGGYHLAFGVAAGFVVLALAVAVALLRPQRAPEPSHGAPGGPRHGRDGSRLGQLLRHDGQEEEGGEQRQVDAALLQCRAPRQHGERADHGRDGQQDHLGRLEPEHERAVDPDAWPPRSRGCQPDARDRGAEGEVEARLHPVAPRVADRRERLRREHEQRDDHADRRRRGAGRLHRVLDRRRLDLRQADHGDERDRRAARG